MNCLPCFQSKNSDSNKQEEQDAPVAQPKDLPPPKPAAEAPKTNPAAQVNDNKPPAEVDKKKPQPAEVDNQKDDADGVETENISAKTFTFRELATATKNFKQECLIGESGFGRVFKGTLPSGQFVSVKKLDKSGTQGNKEFLVEVMILSLLRHQNLVDMIGYCADGDQRLLVYEYLPLGSVEDNLHGEKPEKKHLDWATRMKIASGAAQGLEYLHEKANPPVVYRDLKSSNIMLDEELNAKLYDYGLAKLGGNNTHATALMGNFGYCAPEYERQGEATIKSDVYSFGVFLLELITGRKAMDTSKPADDQKLVAWAQPFFRDPKRFLEMADPLVKNEVPVTSLNQAVGVAAMCLQDEPDVRPLITDVVATLSFLATAPPDQSPVPIPALSGDGSKSKADKSNSKKHKDTEHNQGDTSGSDSESWVGSDEESTFELGNNEVDFEVASMSSCSISSVDEESEYEIPDKRSSSRAEDRHGNNSSKFRRKSTKKSHDGGVRSSSRRRKSEQ